MSEISVCVCECVREKEIAATQLASLTLARVVGHFLLHNETAISEGEPTLFFSNKSAEVKKVGSDGRQGEEKEGGWWEIEWQKGRWRDTHTHLEKRKKRQTLLPVLSIYFIRDLSSFKTLKRSPNTSHGSSKGNYLFTHKANTLMGLQLFPMNTH